MKNDLAFKVSMFKTGVIYALDELKLVRNNPYTREVRPDVEERINKLKEIYEDEEAIALQFLSIPNNDTHE